MKVCSVEGCGRPHKARGLCMRCYQREWQRSAPGKERRLASARAWKAAHPGRRHGEREREARGRRELSDWYVRELLRNQGGGANGHAYRRRLRLFDDISPALIEAKRAQLQILRLLRSFKCR